MKKELNTKKKSIAFTLSEVLITLGIIGIVAALTIPVLMRNYQDTQFKVAYKKAYSAAQQAVTTANQNDLFVEDDFLNNFLAWADQFKVIKKCVNNDNDLCWDSTGEKYGLSYSTGHPTQDAYAFIDSSGVAWSMYYNGAATLFVDTNGFKKPNQWGKDRFGFRQLNEQGVVNVGTPFRVGPFPDNTGNICYGNQCGTDNSYFGTTWLYK